MRALGIIGVTMAALAAGAWALPAGFKKEQIGTLDVAMLKCAPDGRVFVTEKNGKIRVIKNDVMLPAPFVNISSRVNNGQERGMLGIAVDPDFLQNGWVYAFWNSSGGAAYITRWTAQGDVAAAGSEKEIFNVGSHGGTYHHGGYVGFGPDGKMYITRGNRQVVSQSGEQNTVFGKILRINKDGSIPDDNPWYNSNTGNARAAWVYGVRNPFNVRFKPGTNTAIFADVQDGAASDELNFLTKGAGYGYGGGGSTGPIIRAGSGSALMGGVYYNGPRLQFPSSYHGKYFFGNSGGGAFRVLDPEAKSASSFESMGGDCVIDVDIDRDGALWTTNRCGTGSTSNGKVYKFTYPAGVALLPPLREGLQAGQVIKCCARPGGRVTVEFLKGGAQSARLVDMGGRVLAEAGRDGAGAVELAAPGAQGVHLVVWQDGANPARSAAATVLLNR